MPVTRRGWFTRCPRSCSRILAIACGYADADDLDALRTDPAFKLACGRLPESGADLMSQPTVSRWENAPGVRDLIRLAAQSRRPRHRSASRVRLAFAAACPDAALFRQIAADLRPAPS